MKEIEKNTRELNKVEKQLKKQNAFSEVFLRGLVTALGATVGLSIVVSVLVVTLSFVSDSLGLQFLSDPLLNLLKK